MKHTSKRMKHTEINAMKYAGPRSFSLVTAHTQDLTRRMHPTPSEATCVVVRTTPNEWPHELPCAAPRRMQPTPNEWPYMLPCVAPHKGPVWALLELFQIHSMI